MFVHEINSIRTPNHLCLVRFIRVFPMASLGRVRTITILWFARVQSEYNNKLIKHKMSSVSANDNNNISGGDSIDLRRYTSPIFKGKCTILDIGRFECKYLNLFVNIYSI